MQNLWRRTDSRTEHGTTPVLYWINNIYMSPILIQMTDVLILKKLSYLKSNRLNNATYLAEFPPIYQVWLLREKVRP